MAEGDRTRVSAYGPTVKKVFNTNGDRAGRAAVMVSLFGRREADRTAWPEAFEVAWACAGGLTP